MLSLFSLQCLSYSFSSESTPAFRLLQRWFSNAFTTCVFSWHSSWLWIYSSVWLLMFYPQTLKQNTKISVKLLQVLWTQFRLLLEILTSHNLQILPPEKTGFTGGYGLLYSWWDVWSSLTSSLLKSVTPMPKLVKRRKVLSTKKEQQWWEKLKTFTLKRSETLTKCYSRSTFALESQTLADK